MKKDWSWLWIMLATGVGLLSTSNSSQAARSQQDDIKVVEAAPDHHPRVDVTVTYERDGQVAELKDGDILTGADNYRIIFQPRRDSYVYVYQIDADERVDPIFPNPKYSTAANPVAGRIVYSIPPEGRWLHLDRSHGTETILVFASDVPIADPPSAARGLREVTKSGAARVNVAADGEPLFSYRLKFEHK